VRRARRDADPARPHSQGTVACAHLVRRILEDYGYVVLSARDVARMVSPICRRCRSM
jgi:hypothetical protein